MHRVRCDCPHPTPPNMFHNNSLFTVHMKTTMPTHAQMQMLMCVLPPCLLVQMLLSANCMKALGVNAKPESVVSMDNSAVVTMRSESTYKTIKVTFQLNEGFDERTACVTSVAALF